MRSVWLVAALMLAFALGCGGLGGDTANWDALPDAGAAGAPAPASQSKAASASTPAKSSGAAASGSASSRSKSKGQIQLQTAAGVQLFVDGQPITYDLTSGSYIADVAPGSHQIEVSNLLGKQVGSDRVDVQAGKRVRYRYQKKELSKLGVVTASFSEAPPPAAAPQAPQGPPPGSLQFAEIAPPSARVWVGGREVAYSDGARSFVSAGLTPGQYQARVELDRQVIFDGLLEARSGQNQRCLTAYVGFRLTLDCHFTQPAL